jgi:hypothetical protein
MKRIAALCFMMSLFYPNTSWAVKLKKIPVFCGNILASIARGDLKSPGDVGRIAALETHFDQVPTLDYDPINLARGVYPLLIEADFNVFLNLSIEARAYLLTKYSEYFSSTQLLDISNEDWFIDATEKLDVKKTQSLKAAVKKQIEVFEAMADGADQFDYSIKKKYTAKFRIEAPDTSDGRTLNQIISRATERGHEDIYNYLQQEKDKGYSKFNAIALEIDSLEHSDIKKRKKALTPALKKEYARELTPNVETNNAYFEFLLLHHRDQISPAQFLSLVELYQKNKRMVLRSVLPYQSRSESWNFYGEILRAAHGAKLSLDQIGSLASFFNYDALAMSRGDQKLYGELMAKIWEYGNTKLP